MPQSSGSFTIGGASPDYATIQLWDDDAATTLDGILEGKCRPVTFDENVTIGGSTSTSSFYKKLTYDTGAFHAGVFGAGVIVNPAETKISHVFTLGEDFTRVVGIEVTDWQGTSAEAFRVGTGTEGDQCRIEQVLMHNAADINADGVFQGIDGITIYTSNNFYGWLGRQAVHVQGDVTGTIYVYNSTGVYLAGLDSDGYCGFGYDLNGGPLTSHTMHIKNTYCHVYPSDATTGQTECYRKVAAASWGNSTHNASSDATAEDTNGTNFQNNAAVADQIVQALAIATVGENTGDDYSGSWEDSWMNAGATSSNFGGDADFDVDNSDRNALFRVKLDLVPNTARVKSAFVMFQILTEIAASFMWFKVLRNWTEGGVTWDDYDGSNPWTTGGALSHNNDIYNDATYGGLSGVNGARSISLNAGALANGDYWRSTGGALFAAYVQTAIDGSSGAPKGDDWIDVMWDWRAGVSAVGTWDSSEGSDGERPYMELYYDTAAAPFNAVPDAGGILDSNATNLSSDGDYPITADIQGLTRSSWDIGAYKIGVEHSGAASVTGVIDPITATWIREIERTASVSLAGTVATPAPYLTIARTAAVTLVLTETDVPRMEYGAVGSLPVVITTAAAAGLDIQRAELVSLEVDASAGEAGPIQYLRPISDVTVTNFEDEVAGTTDIFDSINEVTRSDANYIVSNSGAGGTYEGALTSRGDPESSEMHVLRVVAESDGGTDMDATFSIVEGSTVIASWTVEDVPAGLVEYAFRLTPEQNDNITDYTNLRWRVVVEPTQALLTYFPGDAGGTFTRTGTAWEWRP